MMDLYQNSQFPHSENADRILQMYLSQDMCRGKHRWLQVMLSTANNDVVSSLVDDISTEVKAAL